MTSYIKSSLLLLLYLAALATSSGALADSFRAVASGNWHDPSVWSPRAVPGANDTVLGLGSHDIRVSSNAQIGLGLESDAIVVDGSGRLIIGSGSSLTINGHLLHSAYRGELVIEAGGALLFNPRAGQVFQFKQRSSGQKVTFAGQAGWRARIGRASGAAGYYYFDTVGYRDSRFNGAYGIVEDAFNPVTEAGWFMAMNNDPGQSEFIAHHIEFLRCGEISIFGLGTGANTRVELDSLTFRQQAKSRSSYSRPAFWFDGYGGANVSVPNPVHANFVTNIISDTLINLRFVQGYKLDNYVIDGYGTGHARSNNRGNARTHNNVFVAMRRGGLATGILADEQLSSYIYAEADNPHGWSATEIRGDALIRNYWFESSQQLQSDNGDAILSNGPQRNFSLNGGRAPQLTIEHSGSIGDTAGSVRHPVFFSYNNSEGLRVALNHIVSKVGFDSRAIAVDENGTTPSGAGLGLVNSAFYLGSDRLSNSGHAIGSASAREALELNTFLRVDHNLYYDMASDGVDGNLGVHKARFTSNVDQRSVIHNPRFFDAGRDLAGWDRSLGGPGTAEHAIQELKKRNDDTGFDSRYTVEWLTAWISMGYAVTDAQALGDDGLPMGAALHLPNLGPEIFSQTESARAPAGATVTLNVRNTGLPTPDYQWFRNNNAIPGANANTLRLTVSQANTGTYQARVRNSVGTVFSDPVPVSIGSDTSVRESASQPPTQTIRASQPTFSAAVSAPVVEPVVAAPVNVEPADQGTNAAPASTSITSVAGDAACVFQQATDGSDLLVFEAENHHGNVARSGRDWVQPTEGTGSGFSGQGVVRSIPDSNMSVATGFVENSPRLDYNVRFEKTGRHYVYVRGRALNTESNSLHFGINNSGPETSDNFTLSPTGNYEWTLRDQTVDVARLGVQSLHIWMREDGTYVDKVILTTDPSFTPVGTGPQQSNCTTP